MQHLKQWEQLIKCPYLDATGTPTIGYGNTYYLDGTRVSMNDECLSVIEAEILLINILIPFEKNINKVVTSKINQNQYDALVHFSYNVGIAAFNRSTLLKVINNDPMDIDIILEFKRWNKSKGKILKGLTNRRNFEAKLYFTPIK